MIDSKFFDQDIVEESAEIEEDKKIYINGLSEIRESEYQGTIRGSILYQKKIIPI